VTSRPLTPEFVERRFAELEQLARLGSSLLEAELPPLDRGVLERRSLRIGGRLSPLAHSEPRDVRLFVSPVAIDRQLGWMPDCWVDPLDGRVVAGGLAVLVAASVEGVGSLDALPRGRAGSSRCDFSSVGPRASTRSRCSTATMASHVCGRAWHGIERGSAGRESWWALQGSNLIRARGEKASGSDDQRDSPSENAAGPAPFAITRDGFMIVRSRSSRRCVRRGSTTSRTSTRPPSTGASRISAGSA
jgi:hypothetical protein